MQEMIPASAGRIPSATDPRRIAVVGPCASGKTTLVNGLRAAGYDAHASGQEHSEIAALWQRGDPDVLIALEVSIEVVRERRGESWPEWLHDLQLRRLTTANSAADLVIDSGAVSASQMVSEAIDFLEQSAGTSPSGAAPAS
ncbi:MAG: hypothetical protein IT338_19040 [Thermomicrobiales bacterium]|nr:hypothetical protein [Thermomicrobiales bacterium]